MSSSYAVQVQRIYGVPGSENVGYGPNDLNIVPSNVPSFPRNQNPIQVSSTGSSTDVKTIAKTGTEINFYKIEPTGLGNQIYRERGIYFDSCGLNQNKTYNFNICFVNHI